MKKVLQIVLLSLIPVVSVAQNLIWSKWIGGSGNENPRLILSDSSKNIFIAGYFSGTTDFDPGAGTNTLTGNYEDIFLTKLDSNGNMLWTKQIGSSGSESVSDMKFDANGNILFVGQFTGTSDFDPGIGSTTFISAGLADIFILKLDPSGNFIWAKQIRGSQQDQGNSIEMDNAGYIYISGSHQNFTDFDPGPGNLWISANGGYDLFIAKYTVNGDIVWAKNIGGAGNEAGANCKVILTGTVFFSGQFENTVDFDPGSSTVNLTSNGFQDVFVMQLDSGGNFVWVKQFGGSQYDNGRVEIDNKKKHCCLR